ncbi:hypothetical protein [Streptomyces aureus]|uniref:hypothetical protein n=1 Tax=Streptomyces aureus TaxID=193461 RepID=UPI0031D84B41
MIGPQPPQQLADTMHAAWTAFAATGDPGWPAYHPPERSTMRFDTRSEVLHDPRPRERALWDARR